MDAVKSPGIVQRHPELRWLASVAVVAAVATVVATTLAGVFDESHTELPTTGPTELVAKVRAPHAGGYYGTVIARMDLGLSSAMERELDAVMPVGGALLHGSHTMRYWYGGTDRQRTAIVAQDSEQDVFRNGSSVLTWDSRTREAMRTTLASSSTATRVPLSITSVADLAPPQLAERIVAMSNTSETVLRSGEEIDDRPTYELVVRPKSAASRIDSAVIEVDGAESVPLAVRVYARGSVTPAVDVAFQSITFGEPAAQNFTFVPPDGSVRAEASTAWLSNIGPAWTTGTGWTSVVSYRTTPALAARLADAFGGRSERIKATWGRGRVACLPILCLLTTRDGRILAGAVDASDLVTVAGR